MCPAESRRSTRVAVSRLVDPLYQITCLLEFNREEEGGRDINSLHFNALWIGATDSNLIRPETDSARVRLASQKVYVVLMHKEVRHVDRIGAGCVAGRVINSGCRRRVANSGKGDRRAPRRFRSEITGTTKLDTAGC